MNKMILHHYPTSPFAEKIRLVLGFKQAAWASVIIPTIMPKPDVVALTGGYRKTPILQVGADIYCDTALIAEEIDARISAPPLYSPGIAAAARTLAQWADSTLFWTVIPYTMQPAGLAHLFQGLSAESVKAFGEDRNAFRAAIPRMRPADAVGALVMYLERLAGMLGSDRFFFGTNPCIADFSVYHNLWYIGRGGPVAKILDPFPTLIAFRERMREMGHGTHEPVPSGAAIETARSSTPQASAGITLDTHGIAAGEAVVVRATDTGIEPVEGALYAATRERISIVREDARAGRVVVHFPRLGFEMRRPKMP
jgi:glutathione S-transferase